MSDLKSEASLGIRHHPDASRRRSLVAACVAHAVHDGLTDVIYVLLPIWQVQFAINYAQIGLLRGLYSGTMAGFQLLASRAARRWGRERMLVAGTALAGVAYLIAGQVDMLFDGLGSSATHIKAGRIKALAVAASKRATGFPDVPTSIEAGVPTYQVSTWYGLWAPKGTPKDIVDHMQAELAKALASPELQSSWTSLGTETPNLYGAAFGKFVSSEIKRWAEVVKSSGAKLDS